MGVDLPYVPNSYNSNIRTRNMMKIIAVRESAHVSI